MKRTTMGFYRNHECWMVRDNGKTWYEVTGYTEQFSAQDQALDFIVGGCKSIAIDDAGIAA